ncbi:MAG: hypothetical protein ABIF12_01935 [bacterium]
MLFNKTIKLLTLLSVFFVLNASSMKLFNSFKDDGFETFKTSLSNSILTLTQTGGLFSDQDGFRENDYSDTISEGINSYFKSTGPNFFSKLKSNQFNFDNIVSEGLLRSITTGNSRTRRSLRSFFDKKEIQKDIKKSIVEKIKKIKSMTWKEHFKNGIKWGIPYSIIGTGFYFSLDAFKDYVELGRSDALQASYLLFIPCATAAYLLAKHGLKKGLKKTLLVNVSLIAASIVFINIKSAMQNRIKNKFWR